MIMKKYTKIINHESNTVYGMGLIGALVYNMQYAHGVSQVLYGVFKSVFWPAYLVYQLLVH